MRYLHSKHKAKKGDTIVVQFDQPTRVLLLSDKDYKNYKLPRTFSYYGGHMEDSPHEFEVPEAGMWHIVLELGYFNPIQLTASSTLVAKSFTSIDGDEMGDEEQQDVAETDWSADASNEAIKDDSEDDESAEHEEDYEGEDAVEESSDDSKEQV